MKRNYTVKQYTHEQWLAEEETREYRNNEITIVWKKNAVCMDIMADGVRIVPILRKIEKAMQEAGLSGSGKIFDGWFGSWADSLLDNFDKKYFIWSYDGRQDAENGHWSYSWGIEDHDGQWYVFLNLALPEKDPEPKTETEEKDPETMKQPTIDSIERMLAYYDSKQMEKNGTHFTAPNKFMNDYRQAAVILAKPTLSAEDRALLLTIYKVSAHDTGKIEGVMSCDSSAHGCEFCQRMREAAKKDQSIICGRCYDWAQEEYRYNVGLRHCLNMAIMSRVEFTVAELAMLPAGMLNRINSSGDVANETHAINMVRYAKAHAGQRVTLWAKNVPAVEAAFDSEGKPENMLFVQSSIHINRPCQRSRYADYTFTVWTPDRIKEAIAAGAMECNGRKCRECGYKCYFGTWPDGADIAEVLR